MAVLTIATHDGTFHTDDVFACATLSLAFKDQEIEIVRTRDGDTINNADIVFDVGDVYDSALKRFDHHQKGGTEDRENGIPYASFGLVWKEYGTLLCGDAIVAELIDERLVQCIDGPDNGIGQINMNNGYYPYGIIDVIIAERPTWQESLSMDEAFMSAVNIAMHVLTRSIAHTQSYIQAKGLLQNSYDAAPDKRIIEIDREYPGTVEFAAEHSDILYVIYKRESSGWSVKAARLDGSLFESRKPLPLSWAGLRDTQLQRETGVSDAIFCHKARFMAVAASREGAWALAKSALQS